MRAFHSASSLPRAALVLNTFANRACQPGKSQSFIVSRTCADRRARSNDTGTISFERGQLDRCEAVGATLRASSRATNTGTRKQTRTRTQTNQLKGKRGIWTWVREPNHDKLLFSIDWLAASTCKKCSCTYQLIIYTVLQANAEVNGIGEISNPYPCQTIQYKHL